jgi:hypothetical protein
VKGLSFPETGVKVRYLLGKVQKGGEHSETQLPDA